MLEFFCWLIMASISGIAIGAFTYTIFLIYITICEQVDELKSTGVSLNLLQRVKKD